MDDHETTIVEIEREMTDERAVRRWFVTTGLRFGGR